MPPSNAEQKNIKHARRLRRNMTDGEKLLWKELREFRSLYGIHIRKQAPVGPYIADFAIHSAKLIIEMDGEHHQTETGKRRDQRRDDWFATQGYRTLRITTGDLQENLEGCLETVLRELGIEC